MLVKVPAAFKIALVSRVEWVKLIFLAGIFILPFVFWPKSPVVYEVPRVWFFQRWVEALVIACLLQSGHIKNKLDKALIMLIFAFVGFAVASSVLGVDLAKSFWGNYYRADGLITLFHLVSMFLILALFWQKSWMDSFVLATAAGSSLVSIWVVGEVALTKHLPAVATFGQANFLAGYLLVTLPFTHNLFNRLNRGFLITGAFLCQLAAIILTLSWAGIVGIFLFAGWGILTRFRLAFWWFLLPFLIIAFLWVVAVWRGLSVDTTTLTSNNYVFEGRTRIYTKALFAFFQRPLLGWGWANFDYAFDNVAWPLHFNKDVWVDKAHSTILEVLVTTGFGGFLLFGAIVIRGMQKLWRVYCKNRTPTVAVLFLVYLLFIFHSQINIISVNEEVFFWVILGIVAAD